MLELVVCAPTIGFSGRKLQSSHWALSHFLQVGSYQTSVFFFPPRCYSTHCSDSGLLTQLPTLAIAAFKQ